MDQISIIAYWKAVCSQDADTIRPYFCIDGIINWHNTNECFDVEAFITANCKYPGSWKETVFDLYPIPQGVISITKVSGEGISFHVTSIFRFEQGKIKQIDEYWSEDGEAPQWRKDMKLTQPISIISQR